MTQIPPLKVENMLLEAYFNINFQLSKLANLGTNLKDYYTANSTSIHSTFQRQEHVV
jgi:hypothetical protein